MPPACFPTSTDATNRGVAISKTSTLPGSPPTGDLQETLSRPHWLFNVCWAIFSAKAKRPCPSLRERSWVPTKSSPCSAQAVWAKSIILVRERSTGSGEAIDVVNRTQITSSPSLDTFPALSPDGNALAYSSNRSGSFEIRVRQLTPGGGEIQLTSDGEQNIQPAWSSDGQRIAYSRLGGGASRLADSP